MAEPRGTVSWSDEQPDPGPPAASGVDSGADDDGTADTGAATAALLAATADSSDGAPATAALLAATADSSDDEPDATQFMQREPFAFGNRLYRQHRVSKPRPRYLLDAPPARLDNMPVSPPASARRASSRGGSSSRQGSPMGSSRAGSSWGGSPPGTPSRRQRPRPLKVVPVPPAAAHDDVDDVLSHRAFPASLEDHIVDRHDEATRATLDTLREIASSPVGGPRNVLIYGAPGSGKTGIVRAYARALSGAEDGDDHLAPDSCWRPPLIVYMEGAEIITRERFQKALN